MIDRLSPLQMRAHNERSYVESQTAQLPVLNRADRRTVAGRAVVLLRQLTIAEARLKFAHDTMREHGIEVPEYEGITS